MISKISNKYYVNIVAKHKKSSIKGYNKHLLLFNNIYMKEQK
ncbi:hypothetical protein BH23BAC3_BH23BAC3_20750 [soil metagenome]